MAALRWDTDLLSSRVWPPPNTRSRVSASEEGGSHRRGEVQAEGAQQQEALGAKCHCGDQTICTAEPFRDKEIPEIEHVRLRFERGREITPRSVFSGRKGEKNTKEHSEFVDRPSCLPTPAQTSETSGPSATCSVTCQPSHASTPGTQ